MNEETTMFAAQIYTERRARLRERVGSGVILLPGNEESPMNYPDNTFRFRQDGTFLYFFGLDAPHLAALIDADEGEEVVYGDEVTMDDIIWMGPQRPLAEKAAAAGAGATAPHAALGAALEKARRAGRPVHYLPPYRGETALLLHGLLGTPAAALRAGASLALTRAVVEQRSVKSSAEVAEIEKALEISHEMHTAAMRMARPGMVEREVAGVVDGIALARGGRNSFPTIFTTHGETLHNHYHGNVLREGNLVLHDSGAESPLHYASDITRTFPAGGKFTERQREVYSAVLAAQKRAIAAVRPGVEFREVHSLACEVLAGGLVELGLMRGDPHEAVRAGAHALFCPHGLGHMLGLDVHDMEGLGEDHVGYDETIRRSETFGFRALRLGRALREGFVLTMEPGLYFIPALIDQWKAAGRHAAFIDYDAVDGFRDFGGIRIEDDVLVLAGGSRVLGRPIPKTVADVEAACSR
ncbi:MAG: aminopeptidase P family protein [Planctomycetota bacterium]